MNLLRGGWGATLMGAPGPVTTVLAGAPLTRGERAVFRVLGARHLTQALVAGACPGPAVLMIGAWVDLAHAATALLLAAFDRRRTRVAVLDAAIAGTWALASCAGARRSRSEQVSAGRSRAAPWRAGTSGWREHGAAGLLVLLPGRFARSRARR